MKKELNSMTDNNNKLCYETAAIEIVSFITIDVITGSNDGEWDDE